MLRPTLRSGILGAATSATVTSGLMPKVIRRLTEVGRLDQPNHRSSHVTPTPRGGGLACAAGVIAGLGCGIASGTAWSAPVLAGVSALTLTGYLDDRIGLAASLRLGTQVVVGATVGLALRGGGTSAMLGMVVVPVVVNSFNFMDGINGISAGEVIAWAVNAFPILEKNAEAGESLLVASAFGAAVSFVPWNVPGARIFLGDTGSYLFGSVIALTMLSSTRFSRQDILRLSAPYFFYLADTGWTLLRRFLKHEQIMVAHRDHIYQKLVDVRGVEHWHVAGGVAFAALMSGALAKSRITSALIPFLAAGYLASPMLVNRLR